MDETGTEDPAQSRVVDYAPWHAIDGNAPHELQANAERLDRLRAAGHEVATSAYVAREAVVDADLLALGERSYLAAHTHITGRVRIGAESSVNLFTAVRGDVTIGDGVRIGASTSILAFDHGTADPETPIRHQPHTSTGITIDDDVWLGAHVLVLDGVRIGAHSVIGAGAVVIRGIPAYSVAVGNPARVVRDRRTGERPVAATPAATPQPSDRALARQLGERARAEIPTILARARRDGIFTDAPGARPTVRATCDAVELADLVGCEVPGGRADTAARLVSWQTPDGVIPELVRKDGAWQPGRVEPSQALWPGDSCAYHLLCVGYALDLLGSALPIPATTWLPDPAEVPSRLAALDWATGAWGAGATVDTLGTAITWASELGVEPPGLRVALIGWLAQSRDPASGLWGEPTGTDWRLPINGTYRLVRGTLAQWGVSLGAGEELVDSVLRHVRSGILEPSRVTACDALDVVHPLWWARRTGARPEYRGPEVTEVARSVLDLAVGGWREGQGVPFACGTTQMTLVSGVDPAAPSLQGTEMWLTLAWYAADLLNVAPELGYTPRGIHRPTPRPTPS